MFLGITHGYLTKEIFLQNLPLYWEPFCGILGVFLGVCSSILRAVPLLIFCIDVFCVTLTVVVLANISHHVSLCNTMQPTLCIFLNVLVNLKHSLDTFFLHQCLVITVVSSKLRNVLSLSLLLALLRVFGSFCTMFLK